MSNVLTGEGDLFEGDNKLGSVQLLRATLPRGRPGARCGTGRARSCLLT